MKPEFVLLLRSEKNDSTIASNEVAAIMYVDADGAVHLTGSKMFQNTWRPYFENSPAWVSVHLRSDAPLSSLLGRSGYTFGEWYPYDESTKSKYESALASLNDVSTITVRPVVKKKYKGS